jgi:hypothetical protein
MLEAWTAERALALAPDDASAKAGKGLASSSKWELLGHNEQALWGLCQGSGKNPYQTRIDLRDVAFGCSCPSRKFPCKHSLGLLLLFASQPRAFQASAPPDWVAQWLLERANRAHKSAEKEAADNSPEALARREAQQAKRSAGREQKVAAGMKELQLWLKDLVRRGLAEGAQEPASFWASAAARLVDAQAPGAARLVREMGETVNAGPDWQDRLLARAARLYLLAEGYANLDAQPPGQQAQVRSLLGWTQSVEDLQGRPAQADQWAVLAQTVETEDRLRVGRTWLWGTKSSSPALILNFAHGTTVLDVSLSPGTWIAASIAYHDGAWPLRAIVLDRGAPTGLLSAMPGYPTITAALEAYAAALSATPFVEQFPMPLSSVNWVRRGDDWLVQDGDSRTLPARATHGWRLASLGGGAPVGIFGLWDGYELRVWSATGRERYLQLAT